jgi:hypothetical protein
MPRLGDKVNITTSTAKTAPPVVFAVQPNAYFVINTPDELKHWEEDLKKYLGVSGHIGGMVGAASESCSGGCSDDCDMV